jgi:hypothetical protein
METPVFCFRRPTVVVCGLAYALLYSKVMGCSSCYVVIVCVTSIKIQFDWFYSDLTGIFIIYQIYVSYHTALT